MVEPQFRAGRYIEQPTKYKAFIPNPLPPVPPIKVEEEMMRLLSQADLALGRLDGLAQIISEPDLFVYLYVRKEALLSSQIEGTQCSLEDILAENPETPPAKKHDIEEVSNYVAAMNEGLTLLNQLSVSTRLLKKIHGTLLKDVRGSNKTPGEFRTSQNWIGNPGANLNTAEFVPPPPQEVAEAMGDLEKYIHKEDGLPPLIRAALVHAQFETIHPFLDGNGRLGRLLITLLLCHWKIIRKPLIYLSYFFKANRTEYYSKLLAIRQKGDWESWIKFFLRGIAETAEMANTAALDIHQIHQRDLRKIQDTKHTAIILQVFNAMCRYPLQTLSELQKITKGAQPTLQRAVDKLISMGILIETTGQQRNRRYAYNEYLNILTRDTTTRMG